MALDKVTKVEGGGINTTSNYRVGSLDVGSNIQLGNAGVITATSFSGSGANLSGIDATALKDSGGNVKIQAQASGAIYTGIHTFNSGAEVGSNIKLGNAGVITATAADIDDFLDVGSNIKLGNAGVITATSFSGSGQNLTNLPAGLGTALSSDSSNPLNKIYYENVVQLIDQNTTVNPPNSAAAAYTPFADIAVDDNIDLTIEDDDDFVPDILGLSTGSIFGAGGAGGRIRVAQITDKAGTGRPQVPHGLVFGGSSLGLQVAGVATFTGNVSIAGTLTYEDVTNVDSIGLVTARTGLVSPNADIDDFITVGSNIQLGNAGVVTATSFSGSGANLTNLPPSAPVGGASTNQVFFENDTTVGVGYSITSGKNAMSAGPISINAGIAVTVPSGSSWTIV